MFNSFILLKLTKILLPTGRAFRIREDSNNESRVLAISEERINVMNAIQGILDKIIPDNDNFNDDDCLRWETALGMDLGTGRALSDRKMAILRKMAYPGNSKYRGSAAFMQYQLQLAGFEVMIFENRFDDGSGGYYTLPPTAFGTAVETQYDDDIQYGEFQYGSSFSNKIANSVYEEDDADFNEGPTLKHTFFVTGMGGLGTYASIPVSRKIEFRQLLLRLKYAHLVGFLYVNYI